MVTEAHKICVLYVDDEQHNLNAFKAIYRKSFEVYLATSIWDGKQILDKNTIHVLVVDHRMLIQICNGNLSGIIKKYSRQQTILLTTFADVEYLENAVSKGKIHSYFQKPWDDVKLKKAIEEAYELLMQKNS
jgi:two-component system sensor histidine kinase/response regulator